MLCIIYIAFRNLLQKQSLIEIAFVVARKIAISLPKSLANLVEHIAKFLGSEIAISLVASISDDIPKGH